MSVEYQDLLTQLIEYEQKKVDAGLGDAGKLAGLQTQLGDAKSVEEERVARIVQNAEPKEKLSPEISLDNAKLQLNLSDALASGDQAKIEAAQSAISDAAVKAAFSELQAAQIEFANSVKAFEAAKATGGQPEITAAQNALNASGQRATQANETYESVRKKMVDAVADVAESPMRSSVTGTFSAAAASVMGNNSTMDRVAKATEATAKATEKMANEVKPDGEPDQQAKKSAKPESEYVKEQRRTNQLLSDGFRQAFGSSKFS